MDEWEGKYCDPLSLHKYLYTDANPANYTDPSGHGKLLDFAIAFAVAGILVNIGLLLVQGFIHLTASDFGTRGSNNFNTMDAAAIDALKRINQTSWTEDREYGGSICKTPGGKFYYTPAKPGTPRLQKENEFEALYYVEIEKCSSGLTVGTYHTHARNHAGHLPISDERYGPETYSAENFSKRDVQNGESTGTFTYLGTPLGTVKKYIPGSSYEVQSGVVVRGPKEVCRKCIPAQYTPIRPLD